MRKISEPTERLVPDRCREALYSSPGLFGQINHYDEKGHKIGESRPGLFGGFTEYDAKGHKIGESRPGFFGSLHHYDQSGKKTGESRLGLFGGINHYDEKGKKNGHSDPSIFGGWNDYRKYLYEFNLFPPQPSRGCSRMSKSMPAAIKSKERIVFTYPLSQVPHPPE